MILHCVAMVSINIMILHCVAMVSINMMILHCLTMVRINVMTLYSICSCGRCHYDDSTLCGYCKNQCDDPIFTV